MMDDDVEFLLMDVREQSEYEMAKIDGAVLYPMSGLQTRIDELDGLKNQHIVVQCHLGGRSLQVTQWLRGRGFERVQNLTGGIEAWSQQIDASVPQY